MLLQCAHPTLAFRPRVGTKRAVYDGARETKMKTNMKPFGRPAVALTLALSLMAPGMAEAGKKERAIALGIGIGMLGGALASDGDPRAVIGGAVAGGLIGGAVQNDRRQWRENRRSWRDDRRYRHDDRRWDHGRPRDRDWR